jgi:Domain of unknown function (DUF4956)
VNELITAVGPSLGLALGLSMIIAATYTRLQRGSLLQPTFVQAIAVGGVVSALVVHSVGDNVARGIGLVGALTVIRFRSSLKDTRDLIFAFASLSIGVACGAEAFAAATAGTAVFLGGSVLAAWLFGAREAHDAVLTLRVRNDVSGIDALHRVLEGATSSYALMRVRTVGGDEYEHSYHVTFRRPNAQPALLRGVETAGATNAMLVTLAPASNA